MNEQPIAEIFGGLILFWVWLAATVHLSRWSRECRQDRRDAERWRKLQAYRKTTVEKHVCPKGYDSEEAAREIGVAIIRARFDEECG